MWCELTPSLPNTTDRPNKLFCETLSHPHRIATLLDTSDDKCVSFQFLNWFCQFGRKCYLKSKTNPIFFIVKKTRGKLIRRGIDLDCLPPSLDDNRRRRALPLKFSTSKRVFIGFPLHFPCSLLLMYLTLFNFKA